MKIKNIPNMQKLFFILLIVIILHSVKKFYLQNNNSVFKNNHNLNYFKTNEYSALLDFNKFYHVINTELCLYTKPKYIIIITSHASNFDVRHLIRVSYPKDLFDKFNVQMVFLLGVTYNSRLQQTIERESTKYKDIIQGNFIEAYRNLTYKHMMGLKWVNEFCNGVKYVIKMDDDIVVNYYKLFELIPKWKSSQMVGCVIRNMKPIRIPENKWYVTFAEYSNSSYPPFLSGWLYMATISAIKNILLYSDTVPYFWIDDVYVTGILAKYAHVIHTDIRRYFRYDPDDIVCCMNELRVCSFVAAPSGGKYNLHMKFNQHMWQCKYKKNCLNNETINRENCVKKIGVQLFRKGSSYIRNLNNNTVLYT